jgi:hypothetical protein
MEYYEKAEYIYQSASEWSLDRWAFIAEEWSVLIGIRRKDNEYTYELTRVMDDRSLLIFFKKTITDSKQFDAEIEFLSNYFGPHSYNLDN